MGARLALAAVLPPRPRRGTVGVVDGRDERVKQARIVSPAVERAEALEELLASLRATAGPTFGIVCRSLEVMSDSILPQSAAVL
jgi:hypothetical protein